MNQLTKLYHNEEWQEKEFILSNDRVYIQDLYLVKEKKWIEIKGYKRGSGMDKWKEFQTHVSNSELWDKDKLTQLGIL